MPPDTGDSKFDEIISRLKDLERHAADGAAEKPLPIPLIDPTANVLSLVQAAIARQDDLRDAENRRLDELRSQQAKHDRELQVAQLLSQKELALAESRRIDALTLAESRRIDALLAAQQNAVALASEKSAAQAATLATQVATTGAATAAQISNWADTLGKRISVVEQNQYQAGGATMQRSEGRQANQWVIGLAVVIGIAVIEVMAKLWK